LDKSRHRSGEANPGKPPRFKTPEDQRRYELQEEIVQQEAHLQELRHEERVLTPRLEHLREKEKRLEATLQREFCELTPRLAALEKERNDLEEALQQRKRESTAVVVASAVVALGVAGMSWWRMRQRS